MSGVKILEIELEEKLKKLEKENGSEKEDWNGFYVKLN